MRADRRGVQGGRPGDVRRAWLYLWNAGVHAIMRILMVHPGPEFSVADVFNGWKKAFEKQGHEVAVFNTNDRLSFYSSVSLPDYKSDEPPCEHCGQPKYKQAMDKDNAVVSSMQ